MAKLSLANVIRVTVLSALRGLSNFNTSNLALITDEAPIPGDFGNYRVYLDPNGVAADFGSNSETYRLAGIIFSQSPNILTGGGALIVIPRLQAAAAQPATILSTNIVDLTQLTAADYNINLNIDGGGAADLLIGSVDTTSLTTVQTSLNSVAVAAAGVQFVLSGELTAARVNLKTTATGAAKSIVVGTAGTGTDAAPVLALTGSATGADAGVERVKDAILRTLDIVDYFGICLNEKQTDANLTEIAALVQTLDKILFVGSNLSADITGIFTTITNAGYTHTRCLYYSTSENDALDFAAGYASRGLSVNFSGSNTSATMHLKEIVGLVADTGVSQTVWDACKAAGVDVYVDYGVPKIMTSEVNQYFDFLYMTLAFKLRLIVAGFNALATTNTKIPQTEAGMSILKSAYRKVCAEFVTNGSFAPGAWNDSTTFGNPEDHIRNIADFGYYVYALPVALQSQVDRAARIAPLVQIAGKSSGAIHSSDVIVLLEA